MDKTNRSKAFQKMLRTVEKTGDYSYFFNTYARLQESLVCARSRMAKTRITRLIVEIANYAPCY